MRIRHRYRFPQAGRPAGYLRELGTHSDSHGEAGPYRHLPRPQAHRAVPRRDGEPFQYPYRRDADPTYHGAGLDQRVRQVRPHLPDRDHGQRSDLFQALPRGRTSRWLTRNQMGVHAEVLKVWDVQTGRALRTLKGYSEFVNGVAVTLDGKRTVWACGDGTLKVRELETGNVLLTLAGQSAYVTGVAMTADGTRAVSSSEDKTLKVWDLE